MVVNDATASASLSGSTLTVSGVSGSPQIGDYVWAPFFGNGSITGNQLTVTSMNQINGVTTSLATAGAKILNGIGAGATTVSYSGGTPGGAGVYTLDSSPGNATGAFFGPNFIFGMYITAGSGPTYTVTTSNAGPGGGPASSVVAATPTIFTHLNLSNVQDFATWLAANVTWCNPSQVYYVETANEIWNFVGGDNTEQWAAGLSFALWGTGGSDGAYMMEGVLDAEVNRIFKTTVGSAGRRGSLVLRVLPLPSLPTPANCSPRRTGMAGPDTFNPMSLMEVIIGGNSPGSGRQAGLARR